jgi:hypothetical protein
MCAMPLRNIEMKPDLVTRNRLRIFLGVLFIVFGALDFILVYNFYPSEKIYEGTIVKKFISLGMPYYERYCFQVCVKDSFGDDVYKLRHPDAANYELGEIGMKLQIRSHPWFLDNDGDKKNDRNAILFAIFIILGLGFFVTGIYFLVDKDIFVPEGMAELLKECKGCREFALVVAKKNREIEEYKKLKFIEGLK